MAAGISGLAVFYATAGGILLWSGVKGQTVKQTIQAVTSSNSSALSQQGSETVGSPQIGISKATATAAVNSAQAAGAAAVGKAAGGGTPTANKALGAVLATGYGWGPGSASWPYLESGWQEESGWNQYAANNPADPYNNAFGIPQANPGTKMASAGSDWQTNAATQIRWGLSYIKSTYGSPSQVPGWTPNGPASGYQGY